MGFDPRSRARSDYCPRASSRVFRSFDPRSRARSDPRHMSMCRPRACFDPRSRARSDIACSPGTTSPVCFDPRSRARSDTSFILVIDTTGVSIRAPARGATADPRPRLPASKFRSALPREERRASASAIEAKRRFDPRSRARSDKAYQDALSHCHGFDPRSRARSDVAEIRIVGRADVSIRAPARGAT